ncbi:MAG: endo alpha-1,4 polygalactosaminidase [Candidatus Neomarinimicrobiota bacterium]|nr:MAG: endo alpha-1,4 polygalactosaminidase [Candidatus Neomarinimicrobiota bacterium]
MRERYFVLLLIFLFLYSSLSMAESDNVKKPLPTAIISYLLDNASLQVPSLNDTWQWQLSGNINTSYDVSVYEIDLFETSEETIKILQAKEIYVICYFSAGSLEDWREDKDQFDDSVIGKAYGGWAGEFWLDIRSQNVKDVMLSRLDLARQKGCDAIEADNVHGFEEDTGFPLTAEDQLKFNRSLAFEAHNRAMAIGLKNDSSQAEELVDDFDFAVTEELFEFSEESALSFFITKGKPVFNAEYGEDYLNNEQHRAAMCLQSNALGFHTIILPLGLDDAFRYDCYVEEGSVDTKLTR